MSEKHADMLFRHDEGQRLSDAVRKVIISKTDPRFLEIGRIQDRLAEREGKNFFSGWRSIRSYSREEIAEAKVFRMRITSIFEPSGEECGTIYDESTACPKCGSGATQASNLSLDFHRLPRSADMAATIADERVVSQKLAQLMVDADFSGFELRPACHKARHDDDPLDLATLNGQALLAEADRLGFGPPDWKFWVWLNRPEQAQRVESARLEKVRGLERSNTTKRKTRSVWHQLAITARPVACVPPTCFGIDPFDKDANGQYRCPLGHVSGLNVLSEVSVSSTDWDGSDLFHTAEFVGVRRGLLRPTRLILASPKLRSLVVGKKIRGVDFEVAHLI